MAGTFVACWWRGPETYLTLGGYECTQTIQLPTQSSFNWILIVLPKQVDYYFSKNRLKKWRLCTLFQRLSMFQNFGLIFPFSKKMKYLS
jgi:hypothetical protein